MIHTSLSIVERNAFCAFAFSLGSNPAALLRGLARAAVRSRGRASDHDAMKSERDAAQHRERLAIEERDKARSQLAAAEDERDDALAELAHMHERTEVE